MPGAEGPVSGEGGEMRDGGGGEERDCDMTEQEKRERVCVCV